MEIETLTYTPWLVHPMDNAVRKPPRHAVEKPVSKPAASAVGTVLVSREQFASGLRGGRTLVARRQGMSRATMVTV